MDLDKKGNNRKTVATWDCVNPGRSYRPSKVKRSFKLNTHQTSKHTFLEVEIFKQLNKFWTN